MSLLSLPLLWHFETSTAPLNSTIPCSLLPYGTVQHIMAPLALLTSALRNTTSSPSHGTSRHLCPIRSHHGTLSFLTLHGTQQHIMAPLALMNIPSPSAQCHTKQNHTSFSMALPNIPSPSIPNVAPSPLPYGPLRHPRKLPHGTPAPEASRVAPP